MTEEKVISDEITEESSDEQKFDADYVKSLREEAKTYRKDKAVLKKENESVKARLEALEAEKLTDVEKKEARIKELEKQLEDNSKAQKDAMVANYVTKALLGKPVVDADAAILLINKELAEQDDITAEVVNEVVDSVLKAKPYLLTSDKQIVGAGNFAKQDNEPAKDPDVMLGEFLKS